MTKKIAIIGKLESKFKAPFGDPSWEIWGCNVHENMRKIPRFNLWFDIHKHPSEYNIPKDKMFYRGQFDFNKAREMLGGDYLTNSMSIMLMEAIFRGANEIAFYGCRLNCDFVGEIRTKQLQNLRELIFFARGKGIKVTSIEKELTEEYPMYE